LLGDEAARPLEAPMRADGEDDGEGPDEDAKVIVRSNGTVTYVGKDIAYHLWKFGLLGRDLRTKILRVPGSSSAGFRRRLASRTHPQFGGAQAIYNVIDSRQSDPQANVIEALRGMGYTEQAAHYTHFSYEMVALTPRCALSSWGTRFRRRIGRGRTSRFPGARDLA
jgi:arginyl-tRNA synthetase